MKEIEWHWEERMIEERNRVTLGRKGDRGKKKSDTGKKG